MRLPRRIPAAFRTAGGLMSAGILLLAAGGLTEARSAFAFALALIPLASVAVAVGLLGVIRNLRGCMRSVTRVGAAAVSIIGAVAALSLTLMALLMPLFEPAGGANVQLLVFVPYVVLASLSAVLIVVGVAVGRAGLGRPGARPFLITGGLLPLLMPVWVLLHHSFLEPLLRVLALAAFAGLAAIFLAVGSAFRTGESHSEPG